MKARTLILAGILSISSISVSSALPFVDIEIGAVVNADIKSLSRRDPDPDTRFGYGGYGRIWIKSADFVVAPFVKYETSSSIIDSIFGSDKQTHNIQYGAVVGTKLLAIFTPYVGASYSHFLNRNIKDTVAMQYGIKIKIPIIPVAVGVDGSWQQTQIDGKTVNINRIGVTLGIQF